VAISHAMSVLSTSGISPIGGLNNANSGVKGEAIIFLVLIFAISRQTYTSDQSGFGLFRLTSDPEVRMGAFLVATLTALLFLRHWVGALEVDEIDNLPSAASALWGGAFTVMSFLTTTGFESASWAATRDWSGLATPGIILMGLALIGGGVATTAGGVKLLRVYALYKHGTREMDRLVHPSSVGGSGTVARRLRRQGAYVAWVFFMLFALSLAAVTTIFGFFGLDFETATILAVAALSTTGPLVNIVSETPVDIAGISDAAKLVFSTAMVLGRLETLAIIALLNPQFWRA
ncbi:MAG: potassium transporter TrkG, partial [Paracoccaceae bacterium]